MRDDHWKVYLNDKATLGTCELQEGLLPCGSLRLHHTRLQQMEGYIACRYTIATFTDYCCYRYWVLLVGTFIREGDAMQCLCYHLWHNFKKFGVNKSWTSRCRLL